MHKDIIQYNTLVVQRPEYASLPGMDTFRGFGRMFSVGLTPTDRTGTIRWPIRTKLIFPIPKMRPMKKTFAELCDERGRELLKRADDLNVDIYIFWSGGIDSTLVLTSLLKNATSEQKKRLVVLMTEESIEEYPLFYEQYIRGQLRTLSSIMFPYVLGGPAIVTNGEQNDQLFGFDSVGRLMNRYGQDFIHKKIDRKLFFDYFISVVKDEKATNRLLDLFDRTTKHAPIPIQTHFDYLWWVNFSQKWQNTFLRTLTCVAPHNVQGITPDYIKTRYASFYGTEEFQLWSLHNHDKKIRDEWRSYKWVCKDAIYEFTKDKEYRDNKTKRGSLHNVIMQQITYDFIDEDYHYFNDVDPQSVFDPKNDLII